MENNDPISFICNTFKLRPAVVPRSSPPSSLFGSYRISVLDQLYVQYPISPMVLQQTISNYIIQIAPKDNPMLVKRFERDDITLNDIAWI
jgi:hypothetical protein